MLFILSIMALRIVFPSLFTPSSFRLHRPVMRDEAVLLRLGPT